MDPSYKLRNFFLKTVKTINELKGEEDQTKQKKLKTIKELEDDLFYLKESAKKLLEQKEIQLIQYKKIIQRTQKINSELKKIKTKITNP
ncbi:hypothetical protein KO361_01820 [Candidatus Woesearchaeota archaeon]|nr:hypothetical protein [Candidatus Woesearchaeota archaeon]